MRHVNISYIHHSCCKRKLTKLESSPAAPPPPSQPTQTGGQENRILCRCYGCISIGWWQAGRPARWARQAGYVLHAVVRQARWGREASGQHSSRRLGFIVSQIRTTKSLVFQTTLARLVLVAPLCTAVTQPFTVYSTSNQTSNRRP